MTTFVPIHNPKGITGAPAPKIPKIAFFDFLNSRQISHLTLRPITPNGSLFAVAGSGEKYAKPP